MYDVIYKNARIPKGDETIVTNILVKDEKIQGFVQDLQGIEGKEILDLQEHLTIPGCFDSHVHFMDPGFTHRENFLTGTSSAAAGGLTMVMDMPCCSTPSVRSVDNLENKLNAIKDKAIIDYAMWGGVTGEDVREGWMHNVQEQADYGVCAFKCYMTPSVPSYPKVTDSEMLEAFRAVSKTGLPVGIHAENFDLCDYHTKKFEREGRTDGPAWAEARLALAEKVAIELGISFAEETGARLHIVHMSTGIGAKLIGEAKMRGLDVSSEVTPHYLTLNYQEAMSERGSFAKIAPPLRTKKDNEELWEGLNNGSVDFIGTDHAPYEIATEKEYDGATIWNTFPGIPGVETMVPIIVSEGYNKGRITLSKMVDILSTNAAKMYGLYPKKGALEIGSDADLTVIDLSHEWTIDENQTYSMAKYNPLHGMKLKGKPVKTILRGRVVYDHDHGVIGEEGYGQFVRRQTIATLDNQITYPFRQREK